MEKKGVVVKIFKKFKKREENQNKHICQKKKNLCITYNSKYTNIHIDCVKFFPNVTCSMLFAW